MDSDDRLKLIEYHRNCATFYENEKAKKMKYYDERIQYHLTLIAEIEARCGKK